jgi:hypothetical protein
MHVQTQTVAVTCSAGGDWDSKTVGFNGWLAAIIYTKTNFTNGVTFSITNAATGEVLWSEASVNSSKTVCPRQATHSNLGVVGASEQPYFLADQQIRIVVSGGGNATTGTFAIVVA